MMLEELFCSVDDFCRVFMPKWRRLQLEDGKKHRKRNSALSVSEMVTIDLSRGSLASFLACVPCCKA